MPDDNSDMSRDFGESKEAKEQKDTQQDTTPDMIKNHQQYPEYKPDWDTSDVDRDHFEQAEQKDRDKFRQEKHEPDRFDQVDEAKKWSQQLDKGKNQGRDR